jgi:hypothetical protein
VKYNARLILAVPALFVSIVSAAQNLGHIRTVQEQNATRFIEQLQKSDTSSIHTYFAYSYYLKHAAKLSACFKQFRADFSKLPGDTRRFSTLIFPKGLNQVKFRYIGEAGAVLQVEVSYRDGDIHSKIVHLSFIGSASLAQSRKTNRAPAYDFDL